VTIIYQKLETNPDYSVWPSMAEI